MTKPLNFTEAAIKAYIPEAGLGDHTKWDATMPGFGIRVHAGGSIKSYVVMYRIGTKQRKMTLGRTNKVSLAKARDHAKEIFSKAKRGIDEKNIVGNAAADASETFAPTYNKFIAQLRADKLSEGYVKDNERYLGVYFRRLHPLALTSITRKTVAEELIKITNLYGRTAANRAKASGSAFYTWAMDKGYEGANPFHGIKGNKTFKRQRTLTERELKAIWNGLPDNPFGAIVRLLMLTGQRRSEIGGLTTAEINLAKRELVIGEERIKNKTKNKIPLSDPAFEIIEKYYDPQKTFLFGRWDNGPFVGWGKAKTQLDAVLPINNPWILHDLRRTAKTIMAEELDIKREITEAILNHSKEGLEGIYNTAEYIRQKRDALDKYAAHLMEIVEVG